MMKKHFFFPLKKISWLLQFESEKWLIWWISCKIYDLGIRKMGVDFGGCRKKRMESFFEWKCYGGFSCSLMKGQSEKRVGPVEDWSICHFIKSFCNYWWFYTFLVATCVWNLKWKWDETTLINNELLLNEKW